MQANRKTEPTTTNKGGISTAVAALLRRQVADRGVAVPGADFRAGTQGRRGRRK
jgi:hypothetical protein